MILVCFCAIYLLPPLGPWRNFSSLLLFLVLLTVLNAPFDWASLGLTRALLRRGLELGGWWPFFLAVADAVLAAGIIVLLATIIVLGVQTFDHLAEHGGRSPILPLDQLFDGIAGHPTAPEYWWLYALLLLTTIPSLIDLVIGGASLLRGVPAASPLILHFIPVGKAVPPFDRAWIALALTIMVFAGAFLGIAAEAFLAVVVPFYIVPRIGQFLLDLARGVIDFDLPGRMLSPLWGGP
jgi:hypothetical protein